MTHVEGYRALVSIVCDMMVRMLADLNTKHMSLAKEVGEREKKYGKYCIYNIYIIKVNADVCVCMYVCMYPPAWSASLNNFLPSGDENATK